MRHITATILCLALCLPTFAENYEYGLEIAAFPHPREEMTSVSLEGGKPFQVNGKTLEMSFSLYTRPDNIFGTIARVITEKGDNIDLMYTVGEGDERHAMLVNGEYVTEVEGPAPVEQWVDVRLSLNPKTGDVSLDFNGAHVSVKDAGTKSARSFRVCFGLCAFDNFILDDVASVSIKDVEIRIGGKLKRRWDLGVHEENICYDEIAHSPAVTKNPHWILDEYITWREIFSTEFCTEPHVTFDNVATFYMTGDGKDVVTFDINSHQSRKMSSCTGEFPSNAPNQIICTGEGQLLAYNLDENKFASFDPARKSWTGGSAPEKDHDYWNNTTIWDNESNSLISFGGYGHYRYRNKLTVQYPDSPERIWEMTIPEITPRYSPGSCLVDSLIYIFGGRGNLSSHQELSPKFYYDLYAIDKHTFEVTPVWDAKAGIDGEFTPGANMLYDREKDCFYTIGYGGDIFTLFKIGRKDGEMEKISVPTVRKGGSQYIYMSLFQAGKMMYCAEVRARADRRSVVTIFDMSYPPIPASVLEATTRKPKPRKEFALTTTEIVLAAISALLIALAVAVQFRYRKIRKKAEEEKKKAPIETEDEYETTHYYDFGKSSICFFGGFRVRDREGNDITAQFTPTLKYLTILLILYSGKNPEGIMSGKLNSLLWSYKPEEAANNNRNVYISKLRTLLEAVGDIRIKSQNKFWSIEFGEGTYCDYLEAIRLYGENSTEENIDRLLELLLTGMMLPNVECDWADDFKGDFSNETIDFLCRQLGRKDLRASVLLQAANTIFMHDFLNEEALKTKCCLLYSQGKVGLSKNIYDSFIKEYKESIGMDYPVQYKEIIGS